MKWDITSLNLDLKYPWRISRDECIDKQNLLITINGDPLGEVAPNSRFNETPQKIIDSFNSIKNLLPKNTNDEVSFEKLNIENSLKNGLCMALYNLVHPLKKVELETSYSIPILELGSYKRFFKENNLGRFKKIKIKVNSEKIVDRIREVRTIHSGELFIDFNECLDEIPSEVFLKKLSGLGVSILEQPFKSEEEDLYLRFKKVSPIPVFLDESITNQEIYSKYSDMCHGVNIKLMKSGGINIARRQINEAKSLGLQVMIGCMIESSLGISHAMEFGETADLFDLDGHLFLKSCPFNLIQEENGILRRMSK